MSIVHLLVQAVVIVVAYYAGSALVNKWHDRRDDKRAVRASVEAEPGGITQKVVLGERIVSSTSEPVQFAPRPIDPQNPPRWLVYSPKRSGSMAFCTNCHDALESGDKVLLVPHTGQSPELICEGCVKTQ